MTTRGTSIWRTVAIAFLLLVTALAPFGAGAGFIPVVRACGVERWTVKTLGDADAPRINLQPLPSTVPELASQPAPSVEELRQHADSRIDDMGDPPVELSTYTVTVMLLQFKRETDEDVHLVIADPADPSQTMIAEFPDASCLPGTDPALAQQMQSARDSLVGLCGEPQPRFEPCPVSAEVTGVGFFDFQHGQTGVAPNAIELHPVLEVQPSASPAANAEPDRAAPPDAAANAPP